MDNDTQVTQALAAAEQGELGTAMQARLAEMLDYQELMLLYDSALKIVRTKFDLINAEYKTRYQRNPIHSIQTRRKRTASILQKLQRLGAEATVENVERKLHDVAGVRIICSYLDDVYEVAQAVTEQNDVTLVRQKDYITAPKRNGYRSLHLLIRVPVHYAGQDRQMEAEVQIRTIAMDFWASLEHQLKYKQSPAREAEIVERLRICAETIARTDVEMLSIRRCIDQNAEKPSETDQLLEQLSKLDVAFS